MDFLWIAIGALLLYGGGEALVAGAKQLAVRFGVEPLVIGLTVVAFGTSTPELAATLAAALKGSPEVAFGNVVGSNIANLGLVLGLGGVVYALDVRGKFLVREVPFMVAASVLMMWFAWDGEIGRLEASVFLVLLGIFLWVQLTAEKESPEIREAFDTEYAVSVGKSAAWSLGLVAVGIAALTLGAHSLVTGAVGLARNFGISERVIGLTIVAFGTSLPELAGTLVAARRREGDIILGNLIGSNIFNILFILGVTIQVRPIQVEAETAELDLAVMLGFSLLIWPLMLSGKRLARWEGLLLSFLYLAYVGWLFVR